MKELECTQCFSALTNQWPQLLTPPSHNTFIVQPSDPVQGRSAMTGCKGVNKVQMSSGWVQILQSEKSLNVKETQVYESEA